MMKCKSCGATLSKLDKEICPFCGTRKPLEGMEDVTQDITKAFTPISHEYVSTKPKRKLYAAILSFLLGFAGAAAFYIGKKKLGLTQIAISIVLIAGLGCLLFFTGALPNALAFLIPYFAIELVSIIAGVQLLVSNSITDSRGEFLK